MSEPIKFALGLASHRDAPLSTPGRYRSCKVCGQTYDTHDLAHRYHHDQQQHKPLRSY